jgi:hypothetical protein
VRAFPGNESRLARKWEECEVRAGEGCIAAEEGYRRIRAALRGTAGTLVLVAIGEVWSRADSGVNLIFFFFIPPWSVAQLLCRAPEALTESWRHNRT